MSYPDGLWVNGCVPGVGLSSGLLSWLLSGHLSGLNLVFYLVFYLVYFTFIWLNQLIVLFIQKLYSNNISDHVLPGVILILPQYQWKLDVYKIINYMSKKYGKCITVLDHCFISM